MSFWLSSEQLLKFFTGSELNIFVAFDKNDIFTIKFGYLFSKLIDLILLIGKNLSHVIS